MERVGVSPNRYLVEPLDTFQAEASRAKARSLDPFPAEKGAEGSKGRVAEVAPLDGLSLISQTLFHLLGDLQDTVLDEAQLVVMLPPLL